MFEELKKAAGRRRSGGASIDPSVFGDPLALETSWQPAAAGGASFGTHRLKQTSGHRVEFAPTVAWNLFCLLFFCVGSGVLVFQINLIDLDGAGFSNRGATVPLIVGTIFSIAGVCMWWYGNAPRVFDQARAMFWRGRKEPAMVGAGGEKGSSTPLSAIHALQLISEYVSGNKSAYTSYELNLVLVDGSRMNVVDHGNLEHLRADAKTLAQFLNKPIWDATQY
ncbi:MAG: hypothetical protein JRG84_08015 [Deltaproteobacteria bacterium]|nr:hypothetical protein [Deltaproteobacteria bacterium]